MKVREAFSKAFGAVPDGATCHVLTYSRHPRAAIVCEDGQVKMWSDIAKFWAITMGKVWCPDLSDQPADSFVGFFGPAYDAVLEDGDSLDLKAAAWAILNEREEVEAVYDQCYDFVWKSWGYEYWKALADASGWVKSPANEVQEVGVCHQCKGSGIQSSLSEDNCEVCLGDGITPICEVPE